VTFSPPVKINTRCIVLTTTIGLLTLYHLCLLWSSTSGRLHGEFVRLLFLQDHRETDRFFATSGVQLAETQRGMFHYRRSAFSSTLKSRVGNILVEVTALRITLNLDGSPIISKSHTHPSHSQTSRLLTSSLSLGIPVPLERVGATQCM
jgi:hypothetical protein